MTKEKIKTNEEFLAKLLVSYELAPEQKEFLEKNKQKVEQALKSNLSEKISFFYGGSEAKNTSIKLNYDLDVVVYLESGSKDRAKGFYEKVGETIRKKLKKPKQNSIGWEIPFKANFQLTVIPGVKTSEKDKRAFFFNPTTEKIVETNMELQVDYVHNSERTDVIRLVKLWKARREVPIDNFLLEAMVIEACKGIDRKKLEKQVMRVFNYINENIDSKPVLDPANPQHNLTDEISPETKQKIKVLADQALDAKTWKLIFKP